MYVIIRAFKERQERYVNDLLAVYCRYRVKDGRKKKLKLKGVQLGVREIKLYEVVFPETSYNDVLDIMQPYTWKHAFTKYVPWLRRLLKLDKIKTGVEPNLTFNRNNVEVLGIGVKKDRYDKDGVEQL